MKHVKQFATVLVALALFSFMAESSLPGLVIAESDDERRLAGSDRYETAAVVAGRAVAEGLVKSDTVIIARGDDHGEWADGLAASFLAGVTEAPILLSRQDRMDSFLEDAIKEIGPQKAYILGGYAAISEAVETELDTLVDEVKRIEGENRFDTAVKIASYAKDEYGASFNSAYLVQGGAPADSLIAGSRAFGQKKPILLTREHSLPGETRKAIDALDINKITIVGGTGVVGDDVQSILENDVGVEVSRLAGGNRYETGTVFADEEFDQPISLSIVNGRDGLADAVGAAVFSDPIIYVERDLPLPSASEQYLKRLSADASFKYRIFGGPNAVQEQVATRLEEIAADPSPVPDPPGPGTYRVKGHFVPESPLSMLNGQESRGDQVRQVVLIYPHHYDIKPVEEHSFTVDMDRGTPGGMAFVGEDDNFLGYLDLGSNMGSLPSQTLDDNIEEIDLGEIVIDEDGKGEPENNPLGREFKIAGVDLEAAAVAGTFFSAVAMNPDLVESMVKEDQFIAISPSYYPDFGDPDFGKRTFLAFNSDGSIDEAALQELWITGHRLCVHFSPGYSGYKDLKLMYPSGLEVAVHPEDDPSEEHVDFPPVGYSPHYDEHYAPELSVPEPGEYGLYDSGSDDLDIKFDIPDIRTAAQDNLVTPLPQVHLDTDGVMVESISWEYYTPGGNKISSPENILTRIDVQISAHSDNNDDLKGDYDFHSYHGPPLITSILEHDIQQKNSIDLSGEEIYWEDIGYINMAYDDIYNLHYVVGFLNRTEGHTFANVTEDFTVSEKNYKKELSATLLDENKEPVEGEEVAFKFANGAIGSFGNKANSTTTITDKDGVATVNYYGPTEEIEATSTVIKISCEVLVDEANEAEIVVTNEISVSNTSMQQTFYGNENDPRVGSWFYDSRITSGIEAIATGLENEKMGNFPGYETVASRKRPVMD